MSLVLQEVEGTSISRQSVHEVVMLSALGNGRHYPPGISVRDWFEPRAKVRPEG